MALPLLAPADGVARRGRLLPDRGARTTIHVACYDPDLTELQVAVLPGQERLEPWCRRHGVEEALVGGFFHKPDGMPLGEVRTHGVVREHVPFEAPWHTLRACVHGEGGRTRIARRQAIEAEPRGDLLRPGRHPRAALGLADDRIFALVCDGRARHDAGLTLFELAKLMLAIGCRHAINLDGGGSASLVSGGRLQNHPRGDFETPEPGGRPISTALVLRPV